jgi:hypothetical protein
LRAKASPFWIILLLVWANPEHLEPLTLNQRVPGSSPGAPTNNFLKNHNNLNIRWEPAALHGIFGKLLGTPPNTTARRAVLNRAPPFVA